MNIEVLRLALEALEEINRLSVGENAICLPAEIDTAMDALRAAIEQISTQDIKDSAWRLADLVRTKLEKRCSNDYFIDFVMECIVDCYTSQPQRQPLTDEELDAIFSNKCWVNVTFADGAKGIALDKTTARDFAQAIEAAHGIKGET